MVARRKKTRDGGDEAQAAGKKKPRPRKARKESATRDPKPQERGDRPPDNTMPEQASGEAPPAQAAAAGAPKVSLPGELYQRADQWWWRVKLPGEGRAKARPLQSEEAEAPVNDREAAERIAFAIWEHAVQEDAARQIKRESTEKIERLKAQFLDRVRHFTELVEAANAKLEAEAKARAEAEAKLAQIAHAAESKTKDIGQTTEGGGPLDPQHGLPVREVEDTPPAWHPQEAAPLPLVPTEATGRIIPVTDNEPQRQQALIANAAPPGPIPTLPLETGTCECCGATGIAMACLQRIDSGQSLCPRCLASLRADAARIDPDVSE